MTPNPIPRRLFVLAAEVVLAMSLWPPVQGQEVNFRGATYIGHLGLFSRGHWPSYSTVSISVLLIQLIGLAALAALCWLVLSGWNRPAWLKLAWLTRGLSILCWLVASVILLGLVINS